MKIPTKFVSKLEEEQIKELKGFFNSSFLSS